jgi:hypothetical protein
MNDAQTQSSEDTWTHHDNFWTGFFVLIKIVWIVLSLSTSLQERETWTNDVSRWKSNYPGKLLMRVLTGTWKKEVEIDSQDRERIGRDCTIEKVNGQKLNVIDERYSGMRYRLKDTWHVGFSPPHCDQTMRQSLVRSCVCNQNRRTRSFSSNLTHPPFTCCSKECFLQNRKQKRQFFFNLMEFIFIRQISITLSSFSTT